MKTKMAKNNLSASFRDPSGFLFTRDGILYRQVNPVYAEHYTRLMESGLYEALVKSGRLVPHREIDPVDHGEKQAFKILQPERVPFISYPYEWAFSQLKDAALATLSIQKRALKRGLTLKDASAYNMQFLHGKFALIDTLSFEIYREGEPWVAYRQFCQHFLAPLALMAYRDVRLSQLLRIYIDGVPLDLASRLLPARTRWNLGLATHIHLHAGVQKRYAEVAVSEARRGRSMSKQAMLGLIESLQNCVRRLEWKPDGTEWGDYYQKTNYSDAAFEHKKVLVGEWLAGLRAGKIWDLGANTGIFSRVAAAGGATVVAWDIDPAAVEMNYRQVREQKETNVLPLLLDLTNPSPALGWHNRERAGFLERGPVDAVLALALVHHLAIGNNVPLPEVAGFLADCGKWLIVEFIPKSDPQVQKLLRNRLDIFPDYTLEGFENAFQERFVLQKSAAIQETERQLYFMKKK